MEWYDLTTRRYNSLVFKAIDDNIYYSLIVREDFLTGAPFEEAYSNRSLNQGSLDRLGAIQASASSYEYLSNDACINSYYQDFLSGRRNVIVVTESHSEDAPDSSILEAHFGNDGRSWMCPNEVGIMQNQPIGGTCPDSGPDPNKWAVVDRNGTICLVQYCRSEVTPGRCQLQFSLTVSNIVIICNLVKFLCMAIVACKVNPATLCTLG